MSLHSTAGLFAVLAGLVASAVQAAPGDEKKTEKKGKPDYKITIFDDEHLKGKSVIVRQTMANLNDLKFNDKSESISWSVAPGKAAILYDEKNFQRPVLMLVGEGAVEDLGKEQRNALHSITSIQITNCAKGKYPKGISKDIPRLGTEE